MEGKTIEELAKECPCHQKWCFLRELAKHMPLSDRNAIQLRLIYDYKFLKSTEEKADIGEKRALDEFVKSFADKFSQIYQEGMSYETLRYKLFIEKNEKRM